MSSAEFSSLKERLSAKLKENNSPNNPKKINVRKRHNRNSQNDVLRDEAFSLGATEKDLELVQGLNDSEDDDEQEFNEVDQTDIDVGFKDDLQDFIKRIGLSKNVVKVIEEPEDDIDENQEEEEEEEEEEKKKERKEEDRKQPDSQGLLEQNLDSEKEENGFVTRGFIMDTNKLLVPYDIQWYDIPLDASTKEAMKGEDTQLTREQIETLYARGKEALNADNVIFHDEFVKESSRSKFVSQILSNGTLSDKISALTLLVQESPMHNLKSLETLLGFCNKKSRNSILQTINALKDLLINGLLPDRKLRFFKNQPGLSMLLNKRTLAIFYFEDFLKHQFFRILESLEKLSHDSIIYVRSQSITHIFDLLTSKSEQEFNLLRLGVNKLGDIDSKISSKTSYQLLKLQQAHPNMKGVIIDAIVDVALRPAADYHTTYYSIITLNQTILKRSEDSVANKLIKTYFILFEKFLITSDPSESEVNDSGVQSKARSYESKRKGKVKKGRHGGKSEKIEKTETDIVNEKNSKMFSALLTGVNRAFPFAILPPKVYETHLGALFRITHSSNFNTCVQALVLIHQIVSRAGLNKDHYYRTLYESLLDSRLVTSSKQGIYLNLLYKSLKEDVLQVERVEAFVKRILQVCLHWLTVGTISGFFYLLLQLVQEIPQIRNLINAPSPRYVEYQSGSDQEEPCLYDSRKRDPKYAHADTSSLWEIIQFTQHFHPSIRAYVDAFLRNDPNSIGKPDLGLFTLAHFLDRFIYRNAKRKVSPRGSSIMQPLFGSSQLNSSLLVHSSDLSSSIQENVPINSKDWLNMRAEQVKPDEKFFYTYFTNKRKTPSKPSPKRETRGEYDDEDLDENEIWSALVRSQPTIEGDSSDADEDMIHLSDMDSIDSDSDNQNDIGGHFLPDITDSDEADSKIAVLSDVSDAKRPTSISSPKDRAENDMRKKKKRRLRQLPLFASADDYAHLLK